MARAKEFDVDAALQRAVDVFWQQGYEGTSMQDLVEAMGLGRQSIYDTFGNKHELFVQALERYCHTDVEAALHDLESKGGLGSIEEYFRKAVRFQCQGSRKSCLLANTTMELASQDDEVSRLVRREQKRLRRAFEHALQVARDRREIDSEADAGVLSLHLTNTALGLAIQGKGGATRAQLQATVEVALSLL